MAKVLLQFDASGPVGAVLNGDEARIARGGGMAGVRFYSAPRSFADLRSGSAMWVFVVSRSDSEPSLRV